MSKQQPDSKQQADPWLSGRQRFSLHYFRRGQDRKWYFSGQQPGEEVRIVIRRHWWFLVRPGLPFLGALTLLFLTLSGTIAFPAMGGLWVALEVLALLATLATGVYFVYKDLIAWWFECYIVTNKRIITAKGLLEPTRSQTAIEKVQQVGIDMYSIVGIFLGFGTVRVYLAGGDLSIPNVPNPKKIKDAIQGIANVVNAPKPKAPEKKVEQPDLSQILNDLAKGKPVPQLPDADEGLPTGDGDRFRGPRRTFGGILNIPCDVRYDSGEYTVKYIQRSQYVLLRNMLAPIAALLLIVPVGLFYPVIGILPNWLQGTWWTLFSISVLIALGAAFLIFTNYADDVYILTNKRIIDINRRFVFFYETRMETEYKNIRDLKVVVPSVLQRVLDIGNLTIETPADMENIVLRNIDHPFVMQDQILGIKSHKEKTDSISKENKEKEQLHSWFNQVLMTLENTPMMRNKGIPDLTEMPLLEAMAAAEEMGFEVKVQGEAAHRPDLKPGVVVSQNPPGGTIMQPGSKIAITLNRRQEVDNFHSATTSPISGMLSVSRPLPPQE